MNTQSPREIIDDMARLMDHYRDAVDRALENSFAEFFGEDVFTPSREIAWEKFDPFITYEEPRRAEENFPKLSLIRFDTPTCEDILQDPEIASEETKTIHVPKVTHVPPRTSLWGCPMYMLGVTDGNVFSVLPHTST